MSAAQHVTRAFVSLKFPGKVPALVCLAKAIVQAMSGNASFPGPDPTLTDIDAAIAALEDAQSAAYARTRGAVAGRNEKREALVKVLSQLKAYVQKVADGDIETATAVIQSSGLRVRKGRPYPRQTFTIRQGAVSGSVRLTAVTAAKHAAYDWRYSTDGGKTWLEAAITLNAKFKMSGLTPGATVMFRYRAVTRAGQGDWSEARSFLVS